MPIEAKASLLKALENRLSTEITSHDMSKVLSVLADQLSSTRSSFYLGTR